MDLNLYPDYGNRTRGHHLKWLCRALIRTGLFGLLLATSVRVYAEGTATVSPTVSGNVLLSGLLIQPDGNQGSYFQCPEDNRVKFRIKTVGEIIYYGFQWRNYASSGTPTVAGDVFYRIIRPDGSVAVAATAAPSSGSAGYISTYAEGVAGPNTLTGGAGGYLPLTHTSTQTGDYYIEFWRGTAATPILVGTTGWGYAPYFDFTVGQAGGGGAAFKGRINCDKWSFSALNPTSFITTAPNNAAPQFHVYTDDSTVGQLNFQNGFRPVSFSVAMNRYGRDPAVTDWFTGRNSATVGSTAPVLTDGYKIFLNLPDTSIYKVSSAPLPPQLLNPPIVGCAAPYRIRYQTFQAGDVKILLNLDGVAGYQTGVDRLFEIKDKAAGIHDTTWDGLNGLGAVVSGSTTFSVEVTFLRGRFNLPIFDAEINYNGFSLAAILPASVSNNKFFWNDATLTNVGTTCAGSGDQSNVIANAGINNSQVGTVTPAHAWSGTGNYAQAIPAPDSNSNSGNTLQCDDFGNVRTINTWGWFAQSNTTFAGAQVGCITISGTVWDDRNNSANNTFANIFTAAETGTNTGATLYAVLYDNVADTVVRPGVLIPSGGTFTISGVYKNYPNLSIRLTNVAGTVGAATPATATLGSGWVATSPLTNNVVASGNSGTANITDEDFGVEALPTPVGVNDAPRVNPAGTATSPVTGTSFTGTDNVDNPAGTITYVRLTQLPTNATSITVTGSTTLGGAVTTTSYGTGFAAFPAGGVYIASSANGNIGNGILNIDPINNGAVTSVVTFAVIDNASKESTGTSSFNVPFTTITISGTVYNDVNGGTIGGVGIGNGSSTQPITQLYANLAIGTTIQGSVAVNSDGTYSLGFAQGVVANTNNYSVIVSPTAGSNGNNISTLQPVSTITPAAPTASIWVNTAEGTTNAGDGTPDGRTDVFNTAVANIANVDFGIERIPIAGSGSNSDVNPNGTTQVTVPLNTFTNTTISSDPAPGAVTGIRITALPTGATSIVINGTTYNAGNLAALQALVIATDGTGQPVGGTTITVDPTANGVTSVSIPFVARDAAGKESTATGSAVLNLTGITIAGTVYNDVNGGTINGVGIGSPASTQPITQLYANLAIGTTVQGSVAVAANGTYTLTEAQGVLANTSNYSVIISPTAGSNGNNISTLQPVSTITPAAPTASIWVNTAEGTTNAGDGTPDGRTNIFTTALVNVTNVDFGIERIPVAGSGSNSDVNPNGTTQVTVPLNTFTNTTVSTDPAPGAVTGIRITALPTGATSIVINGTTYNAGNLAALQALVIATDGTGQPVGGTTITVDPTANGITTVTIPFVARDAAGKESTATGSAVLNLTGITIAGTVYNDVNGGTIGGVGIGSPASTQPIAQLYANLVIGTTVQGSVAVAANGTYTLGNAQGALANTNGYFVVVSPTAGSNGDNVSTLQSVSTISPTPAPAGSIWVNTAEGTTNAGDGTPDGRTDVFNTALVNVTNVDFGIERIPVAGSGSNSDVNPNGTTQVTVPLNTFTNTTVSSDPAPGAVTGIRITALPTGATSIVINGTTYNAGNLAALQALVIATDGTGQPVGGTTITVDPTANGITTVTIPFVARDAAGKESTATGSAVLNLTGITIAGTVYNDVNGGTIGGVGIGSPASTQPIAQLYANLVIGTTVQGSVAVAANGTYTLGNAQGALANTNGYFVVVSPTAGSNGDNVSTLQSVSTISPTPAPAGSIWVNTAEGTTNAGDGTPDGRTDVFNTALVNVTNVDFGIERIPVAGSGLNAAGANPGGTTQVTVPLNTFTNTTASSDPAPGAVTGIRITALPTGATSIVINGTTYNAGNLAALQALIIATDGTGQPVGGTTITVDPSFNGVGNVSIPFVARDAAGKESTAAGTAVITLTDLTIAGTVYNDVNGGTIGGVGIGNGSSTQPIAQLYANLVIGTTVQGSVAVNSDGTYTLGNAQGVQANTNNYFVVVSPTQGSNGDNVSTLQSVSTITPAAPTASIWVNTAEGTTNAGDGTPDGRTNTFNVVTSNITNVDFGIERIPVAGSGSNSDVNPNGTTQVTVPLNTFTNTTASTDPAPGAVTGIRITALPTGATSIVINGTTYNAGNLAALQALVIATDGTGQPVGGTTITVDPTANGVTSVSIPFVARDAAGKESTATGSAVLNLTGITIAGTVYNDVNGGTIGGVGIGSPASTQPITQLYANLVIGTTVQGSVAVAANGTYTLTEAQGVLANTNGYYVVVSPTAGSNGNNVSTLQSVSTITPAAPTASIWVNTAEGTTNAGDGTPDGATNTFNTALVNVTNVDFGIERIPVAGSGSNSDVNPNGTTQVSVPLNTFTNTTVSSDPAPGAVTGIRITALPTGVTSIVINGTTYNAGNLAALQALVIATDGTGQPVGGTTITVDPTANGATTVTIPFVARDAAGKESTATGSAVLNLTGITIAGTVYNDVNGGTIGGVGIGSPASTQPIAQLYANLVIGTTVQGSVAVAASGTYTLTGAQGALANTNGYFVVVSPTAGSNGDNVSTLQSVSTITTTPAGSIWVNTAEGTTNAGDGTPDGATNTFNTALVNVTNVDFGIERIPVAGAGSNNAGTNPGGTTQVSVPANTFSNTTVSSDPAPGAVTGIRITALPTGATSIVINGVTYNAGNVAALTALIIPDANNDGQPDYTITVDPTADGATSVTIPFVVRDAAGKESANTGNAVINVNGISIAGNVYNDVNGLNGTPANTVDGVGTNGGGLNAILYITGGNVVATTTVNNDGTYSFANQNAGTYSVLITTATGTIGQPAPAVTLAGGYVSTGENLGAGTGSDGTVDGILSIGAVTANVTNANFGIELPPTAGAGTNNGGTNPNGTTQVSVPANTFSNTTLSTDPAPGAVTGIRITALPTGATSIVINGVTYNAGNVAALTALIIPDANNDGQPDYTITVDPTANGTTTVTIPFVVRDAAGRESANTGNAVLNLGGITIAGTVYNDVNGGNIDGVGIGNGSSTQPIAQLYANLVIGTTVQGSVAVAANGTYTLTGAQGVLANTNGYYVVVSPTAGSNGDNVSTLQSVSTISPTPAPAGSIWVNTAEGTTNAGDGTPDGATNTFNTALVNVTNVDFGIERIPVAGAGSNNAGTNPGGTTQVTVPANTFSNTTVSSDPAPGAVTAIRITALPTGATSIVINGVTYNAGNVAALTALIIPDANNDGQPDYTITVDPTADGATSVTIPFVVRDAAGKESVNVGNAVINVNGISIAGNVYNDVNGLNGTPANTVDGVGTNGGGLNAILYTTGGNVVATTTVNNDGTYAFANQNAGTYSVLITTATGTIGQPAPAVTLPGGYVATGENLGAGAGSDGSVNSILSIGAVTANVTNANFGIELPPTAGAGTNNGGTNPGGTIQVSVPANTFSNTTLSTDPAPGAVTGIRITALPTGATSIVINGVTYNAGNVAALTALIIPDANNDGQPDYTITVDPSFTGSGDVTIPFVTLDAAGKESANTGSAVVSFTTSIAGNVYNDVNGLNGTPANTVDGVGTNGGGLNAILYTTGGNVVATTTVAADGTYSFTGLQNGTYSVLITTATGTIGQPAPAVTLPGGYVSTGENLGAGTGSDGTVDGILSIGAVTAPVTNANFGIELPPTAGAGANTSANPNGTTQVTVPSNTFSNTTVSTDPAPGDVTGIRITALPTGATSIVINGVTYNAGNVAALTALIIPDANNDGQPDYTITVDPTANGVTTVTIPFVAVDAAGKESANTGSAVINFTGISITGTVYNDVNGGNIDGVGIGSPSGTQLYANLVIGTTIQGSVTVAVNGTYTLTEAQGVLANTNGYYVVVSPTQGAANANVNTLASVSTITTTPAGSIWVNTAEGTTNAGDGTPDGRTNTFNTALANITNVDFGIERIPVAGAGSNNGGINPGGTTQVTVPATTFSNTTLSTDPAPGAVTGIRITALPTGATSIVINGVTYNAGNVAALTALVIPTNGNGEPNVTITVDPSYNGTGNVTIPFVAVDAAGKESANTGNAVLSLTDLTITGTVYNDANGTTNSAIDGTATNTIGTNTIYANLVSGGNVIASVPVAANGTYTFGNADGVQANTNYTVVVTNGVQTIGQAPVTTLVNGVNTSEAISPAFQDGANNGSTAVSVGTTNVTGVNFGIDLLPVPGTATATSQVNPGGAISVTVPANTFSATDADGTVTSIRITTFPTNANSITVGTTTYYATAGDLPGVCPTTTCLVFPGGGVTVTAPAGVPNTPISVDPVNGAVTVSIPYVAIDNAGKESNTTGAANVPFSDLTISGIVYNDANGTTDMAINGTATNTIGSNNLFANLIDPLNNTVLASVGIAVNGSYTFGTADGVAMNKGYFVSVTRTQGVFGQPAPATTLIGAVNTSEAVTTAAGNPYQDNANNGITEVTMVTASITGVNFGIDRTTAADNKSYTVQPSNLTATPGGGYPTQNGYTSIQANDPVLMNQIANSLSGTDPEDCAAAGSCNTGATFRIGNINANTLLYYNFGGVTGIQPVTANTTITNFNPANLRVYIQNGSGTVGNPGGFAYRLIDAAGVDGTPGVYSISSTTPLPVRLVSFGATKQGSVAVIDWTVENEMDVTTYEVERSADGVVFTTIGEANATGDERYSHTDYSPLSGINHYRLKMNNADGSYSYSKVAILSFTGTAAIRVFPNPATEVITVDGAETGATIRVVSTDGRTVIDTKATGTVTEINISALAAGQYYVQVGSTTIRIQKVR